MKHLLERITTKQLLIIISILLFVISFPVLTRAYSFMSSGISNIILNNKDNYCKERYPEHIDKALSEIEFELFIKKEIKENGNDPKYWFFSSDEEYKELSQVEAMKYFYRGKLQDSSYSEGSFYGDEKNRCSYSIDFLSLYGDEVPWYYF